MKFRMIRTAFLVTAGLTVLFLTACGSGSGTISSLTDSDSTTSSVATQAASDTSSVPAVTPSVVSGQSSAPTAAQPTAAPVNNKAAAGTTAAAVTDFAASTVEEAEEKVPDDIQASPEEEDFEPAGEGNTGKTTTDVNFRSEPSSDGGEDTVIDELSEGTEVTILGKEGDFYKVQVDDVVGYIHSDYIE